MALTVAIVKRNVVGAQREVIADVTFGTGYLTGGEAFTPNDVDKSERTTANFHFVTTEMNDTTIADNRLLSYDYTAKKLVLRTAGATEATNASDQSAVKIRVLCRYGGATG